MFAIKKELANISGVIPKVTFENLSSYDLNIGIDYLLSFELTKTIIIRYEGKDGESLLELMLSDNYLTGISFLCFDGVVESYDSPLTQFENLNEDLLNWQLTMDEYDCDLRIGLYEIDQRIDFRLLIYSDAVIFLIGSAEVYLSNKISDELYILTDKNELLLGVVILSTKTATRFKEVYG